ncbi:hypothetical protein [Mucilaginibacter koreensis]
MKNGFKAAIVMLATVSILSACKGGVSGEKQDSTMLDRDRMDSTSALNHKAGTMAADSNAAARLDSNATDTTKK